MIMKMKTGIKKGDKMAGIAKMLLTKVLSEKVLTMLVIKLGDWLVLRSSNKLDDTLWAEVKKALGKG
tara:strand:- start:877 stop:1077 length:201 start_codon:yes stop_codon:yes gene_type:complete